MTVHQAEELSYRVLPPTRVRRVTARRLRAALQDKPQVTIHQRTPVAPLLEWRRQVNASAPEVQVSITAALCAIVVRALARMPRVNGHVSSEEVRVFERVNLGVAVDTPDGLVVPVVKHAATLTVEQLAVAIRNLAGHAREGTLRSEDVADATFTVSNLGMLGVELFTPLVNPPQMAILGVGSLTTSLELVGGRPVEVPRMGLSLSFDHAAMDGADAAAYLSLLSELMQDPASTMAVDPQ